MYKAIDLVPCIHILSWYNLHHKAYSFDFRGRTYSLLLANFFSTDRILTIVSQNIPLNTDRVLSLSKAPYLASTSFSNSVLMPVSLSLLRFARLGGRSFSFINDFEPCRAISLSIASSLLFSAFKEAKFFTTTAN